MKLKYILISGLLASTVNNAQAVRAYPGKITHVQPDGTEITLYLKGDETAHSLVTPDGFLVNIGKDGIARYDSKTASDLMFVSANGIRSQLETDWLEKFGNKDLDGTLSNRRQVRKNVRTAIGDFPTTGNLKGIVILAEFADNSFSEEFSTDYAFDKMNKEGFDAYGATGSVRDYFVAQSSGKFTPDFDIYGPVKLPQKMAYYGANAYGGSDSNAAQMIADACNIVHDEMGADFTKYDFDNNGVVDFVYVIYAGYAESYGASSNTIWPHKSELSSWHIDLSLDGKKIDTYACSSELKYTTGAIPEGIGPFVHEFSHVLGLPDLYDVSTSGTIQMGTWDVMDIGNYNNESNTPPNYSAFERYTVGWLDLTELTEPSYDVVCPELGESNLGYVIQTGEENDFFVLENRQQRGWDKYQEGKGLMITHIFYAPEIWAHNQVNVGYSRWDLVEADGTQGTLCGTDLYPIPGNDMFTYFSTPAMKTVYGASVDKGVSKIRDDNGVIHFRFMKDRIHAPEELTVEEVTSDSFTVAWNPSEDATTYHMNVREILPDEINPLLLTESFDGMIYGSVNKPDVRDMVDYLDYYMETPGWSGKNLFSAGGSIMIGKYQQLGQLVSPVIEWVGDKATFAMTYRSYTGKKAEGVVWILNPVGTKKYHEVEFQATKNEADLQFSFVPPKDGFLVAITSWEERCFVNRLRLVKGEVDEESFWSCGPKKWGYPSITDTRYKVEGLHPDREYAISLQALCDEEYRTSLSSEEYIVRTSEGADVSTIFSEEDSVTYYDITGRRVSGNTPGILIRRAIDSLGKVSVRKITRVR